MHLPSPVPTHQLLDGDGHEEGGLRGRDLDTHRRILGACEGDRASAGASPVIWATVSARSRSEQCRDGLLQGTKPGAKHKSSIGQTVTLMFT